MLPNSVYSQVCVHWPPLVATFLSSPHVAQIRLPNSCFYPLPPLYSHRRQHRWAPPTPHIWQQFQPNSQAWVTGCGGHRLPRSSHMPQLLLLLLHLLPPPPQSRPFSRRAFQTTRYTTLRCCTPPCLYACLLVSLWKFERAWFPSLLQLRGGIFERPRAQGNPMPTHLALPLMPCGAPTLPSSR